MQSRRSGDPVPTPLMRFVVELLTSALRFVAGEETGSVYGTAGKKVLAEVVPSET
ncbi:MAG: hypothetical protein ACJ74Q_13715 [Pyrinomonadaceae bacterium]